MGVGDEVVHGVLEAAEHARGDRDTHAADTGIGVVGQGEGKDRCAVLLETAVDRDAIGLGSLGLDWQRQA